MLRTPTIICDEACLLGDLSELEVAAAICRPRYGIPSQKDFVSTNDLGSGAEAGNRETFTACLDFNFIPLQHLRCLTSILFLTTTSTIW